MKVANHERPFVFVMEDEVKDLNYEQIIGYLQEDARRRGYEPCDFYSISKRPKIYLLGAYEMDLRKGTGWELTGKCFAMHTKRITNRASGKKE